MFLAGDLSISGCGVETGVAQVFLEHPQFIPSIISFDCHDSKGVSKSMRRNIVHSSRLGIDEFGQAGLFSALFDDLPGSVSVYAKNQLLAAYNLRPTTLYIFSQQLQAFIVNG